MQMVKIHIPERSDRAKALEALTLRGRVICLPDNHFIVPEPALEVLKSLTVAYRELSITHNEQNYAEWATLTRVHFRFAFYSQLAIATCCMIFFEQYLQTGCHPLGWKESTVRFAYSFNSLLFCWVAIAAAIARCQLWRRIICVIASYVLTWVIHEVYWCAIVRY